MLDLMSKTTENVLFNIVSVDRNATICQINQLTVSTYKVTSTYQITYVTVVNNSTLPNIVKYSPTIFDVTPITYNSYTTYNSK